MEIRERGYQFAVVEAGPMSKPIVEKHGFQHLSTAHDSIEPAKIVCRRGGAGGALRPKGVSKCRGSAGESARQVTVSETVTKLT